jgi:hypothetical protein
MLERFQSWSGAAAFLLALGACDSGSDVSATGPEGEASTGNGGASASAGSSGSADPTEATTGADETTGASETGDEPVCGDGVIAGDELCDGAELGEHSCASQGFVDGGSLVCTETCSLDVSGCVGCSDWVRQLGTYDFDSGRALALDGAANVYVVGATKAQLDGNPWAGESDAFITRYAPDGTKLWTRTLGTEASDIAEAVAVDGAGAIYVVGVTEGSLDGNLLVGFRDIFVAKFDPDGNRLWTSQYGTSTGESASGVAVDALDNIYVAGTTAGALEGNTSSGGSDAFVTRFDVDGNRVWTRQFGTAEKDDVTGVAVDASDDIYLAGSTEGALDGEGAGNSDLLVAKFDGDGTMLWTRQHGSPGNDVGQAIVVDGDGDVVVAGHTVGVYVEGLPLPQIDVLVAKFAPDGAKLWTQQFGTDYDDLVYGVAATSDGAYHVVGGTRGQFDGNVFQGLADAFVARRDHEGDEVSTHQFGGEGVDHLSGVVVDAADNLYATGATGSSLGGPESGADDMFVVRLCGE